MIPISRSRRVPATTTGEMARLAASRQCAALEAATSSCVSSILIALTPTPSASCRFIAGTSELGTGTCWACLKRLIFVYVLVFNYGEPTREGNVLFEFRCFAREISCSTKGG